jgi:pimeloyl-ACP methyl ester carboxylesterase
MRGHGQSADPGPEHKWSAEELLLDMKGFLDALGLEKVHYLGESIGGTLGIAFAVRWPERLKSLTLVSAPTSIPPRVQKLFALGYEDWPTALGKLGSGGWARTLMESGGGLTGGNPSLPHGVGDRSMGANSDARPAGIVSSGADCRCCSAALAD